MDWWTRNIVEPGKLPLLLALISFVLAFVVTRVITRAIRAGRGPFRNVTPGGMHIHHVVPGLLLMTVGGFTAFAGGRHGVGAGIAAVVFGVGTGLVLDEFALVLHLHDVYWSEEGTRSVEVVVLTFALTLLMLAGFAPFGVNGLTDDEAQDRLSGALTVCGNFLCVLVTLVKGKPVTALVGVLVPPAALFGAVRLARPGSLWAKRLYRRRPRSRRRATERAARHDRRWGPLQRRFYDLVGGAPDG
ncbi:hypothetical protein [Streptomyces sp. JJ36]|uniref:hypothetical protein n=1 Tax=Streptomyces sp. JJ36 TaxID=2736645 RepID=UPI001F26A1A3|nr:hypothetical protein [Streptomyces sp. JJ36]MCF6523521.1 hypothetical protein [Streptomyces sp. JJ36]